jgi:hypothetical protein
MQHCCISALLPYFCNMVAFNRFFSRFSWDVVGFSASAICAVHCLVVPVLLLLSSFSGSEFLHSHWLETFILVFSAAVGSASIIPSWFRHHRKHLPVLIFIFGVLFIAWGRLDVSLLAETLLTTAGATLVAIAHWLNWKFCRPFHTPTQQQQIQ